MELITRDVKQNIEKVQEIQQVTFDNDYVIKDNKPDVQKIICQTGMVKTDDIKQTGETIWITGNIEFEVLYKSDNEGEKVETIKDLIPFQEKIALDGIENNDNIRVYAKINDVLSENDKAIYNGFVAKMKVKFDGGNSFFKLVK